MIRTRVALLIAVTPCLLLSGCEDIEPTPVVTIASDVEFRLLAADQPVAVTQKITAHVRGERHMMIMQVQADTSRLTMAGMSPTGTRLFSLSFDGKTIDSWKSPLFNVPFDGSYVLADFELAAFPVARLQHEISGGRIEEKTVGANTERRIFDNADNAVIEIIYDKTTDPDNLNVSYCHLERHYCLDITALSQAGTP
ncbi:MAG TPA: DUF3261 domain-containing protein [Pseudomonadales bacterium]|nr:DUF3261 domain-containing protein [Pseudomonadales bacterium]